MTYIVLNFDAAETDGPFMEHRYKILSDYGFCGVGCLNPTVLPDTGTRWRSEEDRKLYFRMLSEGWDFALYTAVRADSKNEEQWTEYLGEWVANMEKLGIFNLTGYHCTGNRLNDALMRGAGANNFRILRCSGNEYSDKVLAKDGSTLPFWFCKFFPINGTVRVVNTSGAANYEHDSVEGVVSMIDTAIENGASLSVMAHLVPDTEEPIDEWNVYERNYRRILGHIRKRCDEGKVSVVTWRELYHVFNERAAAENDYNRLMKSALYKETLIY